MLAVAEVDKWPGRYRALVDEVILRADGDQTILVLEERGTPLDLLFAHGAGVQIQGEDLAAYLSGRERRDTKERWELFPLKCRGCSGGDVAGDEGERRTAG